MDGTTLLGPSCFGAQLTTDGFHTIAVRGLDFAGNVGPFTSPISYTLDTSAPNFINVRQPSNHAHRGTFTVSWTTDDPGPVTYQCTFISNSNPIDCANGTATGAEVIGINQLTVNATDLAGNNNQIVIIWHVNGL